MKDREHHDPCILLKKMNRVRKASQDRSAHWPADVTKKLRLSSHQHQYFIDDGFELQSEAGTLAFIPRHGLVVFTSGDRPEDDLPIHDFRPYFASVAALISFHDTTSSGWA